MYEINSVLVSMDQRVYIVQIVLLLIIMKWEDFVSNMRCKQ